MTIELLPVENITLTMARAQVERGDEVGPNTVAMLVMILDRVTGRKDWTLDTHQPTADLDPQSQPKDDSNDPSTST